MKKNQLINCLIATIVVGMAVIPALSIAVPGNYVIQLQNDASVEEASIVLQNNVPNVNILEFGSVRYNLIAHRIITPTVWIGHGNVDGIAIDDKRISWEEFSEEITFTPAGDIVLACHSNELVKKTSITKEEAFTFNGEIDATFGALLSAFLLTHSNNLIGKLIDHATGIMNSEIEINPLALDIGTMPPTYPPPPPPPEPDMDIPDTYTQAKSDYSYVFAKLSGVELAYHILMLVILIFDLVVGYACAKADMTFIKSAVIEFWICGKLYLFTSLAFHADGQMTDDQLTEDIFGSFCDAIGCFTEAWHDMNAGEKAAFICMLVAAGAVLTAEILLDIFAAGAGTGIRTAASIALILLFIYDFAKDCSDYDTVVG